MIKNFENLTEGFNYEELVEKESVQEIVMIVSNKVRYERFIIIGKKGLSLFHRVVCQITDWTIKCL